MRCIEALRDAGQLEVDAVTLGNRVEAVEIAPTLRLDQRGDGAPGDRHRTAVYLSPIWSVGTIANDVQPALALDPLGECPREDRERRRVEEHLRDRPPVHVHLLVRLSVNLNIEQRRRQDTRYRCRRDEHVAEQLQRPGVTTRGYLG